MKKICMFIMLLGGMTLGVFAQQAGVSGKVVSAADKQAVEYANVIVQTLDSTFIAGTTTAENGAFTIDKLPAGDYRLAISSMGYKPSYSPIQLQTSILAMNEILLEEDAVALSGVTINGSNLTSTSDRKMVYPSERQLRASTNGMNLLQQLMLPKLVINTLMNEVSVPGGGEVQFRINGAKVEREDILALVPDEIIRVEFHDNPGLRYGNAEVVLDYIVRRPDTGGSFGVNLSDALNVGWGENGIRGKVNHKKSEFSANYSIAHRNFYNMWRDNEEKFLLADGSTLHRREEGQPDHGEMYWQNLNASYSYAESDKRFFSATLRYYDNNNPSWDYNGKLFNINNPNDVVNMIDRSSNKTRRPAIDLYYQENLPKDQTLVFNLVGTYSSTDNTRFYQESRNGMVYTDVNNMVEGNRYSIIGEGIYEKRLGEYRISGGVRHTQSFTDNEYTNGHNYRTKMNQSETSAYAEFKGKVKSLDYTLSAGVKRSWFSQEGSQGYENYTFNPRVVLHYSLPGKQFIRLRASINNSTPDLSELSEVEQVIDSIQIQRGNPGLKPYMRYNTELTYEFQKGIFYTNFWGMYEYRPNAIMEEKYQEDDKIVQTWDNQKNWHRLSGQLTMRVGPIKDILQFSVTGGVNHYISNGNNYSHTYTNPFMRGEVSLTFKKFMLGGGMMTNWNRFYGETMSGGENMHYAQARYNHKNLSIGVAMFNPFTDNYKQQTENWSKFASYKRSNYIKESSRMFIVQFTYNFSFGRKFNSAQKRLNNADDASGVMSTGK